MNFKKLTLGLLATSVLASCNGGSSDASTPAPNVQQQGCVSESELMKAGIVGGTKVSNFDADSKKVVLLFAEDDDGQTTICTSTPIAPHVLLTAAHCIARKHFVVYNTSISCESGFSVAKHVAPVYTAVKHEDWDENAKSEANTAKDVAIVILQESLPSSYRISKIADPADVDLTTGVMRFIGYGVVDYKAGGSGILRKTEIAATKAVVDVADNVVRIDQSNGHGVCSGDSGGPSFVNVNGQEQILGVNSIVGGTSKETLCRDTATQTLASGHIPWIKQQLTKFGLSHEF